MAKSKGKSSKRTKGTGKKINRAPIPYTVIPPTSMKGDSRVIVKNKRTGKVYSFWQSYGMFMTVVLVPLAILCAVIHHYIG